MAGRGEQSSAVVPHPKRGRRAWLRAVIAAPAAVLPLLPSFSCPVCLAAYAGVLSSLGLGFVLNESVLRPLIVLFLGIAVGSVAWGTRRHRKRGPVVAAAAGALSIIAGRIVWSVPLAVYGGVICVVLAAIWNLVLSRSRRGRTTFSKVENRYVSEASNGCCAADHSCSTHSGSGRC